MSGPGDGSNQRHRHRQREPAPQPGAFEGQTNRQHDRERQADLGHQSKFVKLSTSRSAPDITASPRPSPLNDIVINNTQVSPETMATASPIQATARTCLRTSAPAGGTARNAGSATKPQKIRAPAVVAEAAKWAVRVTTIGPSISAPNQLIALPQHER
jgi:hypothetical protein